TCPRPSIPRSPSTRPGSSAPIASDAAARRGFATVGASRRYGPWVPAGKRSARETAGRKRMKRPGWMPLRSGPVGGLLLAMLMLTASGPAARAAPALAAPALPAVDAAPLAQGLTPVRVGMQYLISDAGVLLADERGYFRD